MSSFARWLIQDRFSWLEVAAALVVLSAVSDGNLGVLASLGCVFAASIVVVCIRRILGNP